jgi:hypothetical protein
MRSSTIAAASVREQQPPAPAEDPTPVAILGEITALVTGAVSGGLPFLLLSVPGLILFVLLPLVLVAIPAVVVAVLLAPPFLLVRAVRRWRAASATESWSPRRA